MTFHRSPRHALLTVAVCLVVAAAFCPPVGADEAPAAERSPWAPAFLSAAPADGKASTSACCEASCDHGADVECCGSSCYARDDPNGFCWSNVEGVKYCPAPDPVDVTGILESCTGGTQPGERVTYVLRCTASGGNGSYVFNWSGCTRLLSSSGANPNRCEVTTVGSHTATCTATSGGDSDSKTFNLSGLCLF